MTVALLKTHRRLFVGMFVLIVLFQWFHFAVYFSQPVGVSLIWSLVDWSVWFALGTACIWSSRFRHQWMWGIGFLLLAGPVQIILSSCVYALLHEVDKTLLESFVHLMNKRWLQNVFIAGVMLLVVMHLKQKIAANAKAAPDAHSDRLILNDGIHIYQLDSQDVLAVIAAKNYVSVFTSDKEIIVRDTLKNMQSRLEQEQFIQVSRSALVNRSEIKQIERYSKTSFRAVLSNHHTVNIGRTFVDSVQQCLHLSPQQHHSSL